MREFVELKTSIFDLDFTLNPYPYLADMYQRDEVIGFASEGMEFLFRFADCRAVMYAKYFQRGTDDPNCFSRKEDFAKRYIHRARRLENHFAIGVPNLRLKALVTRMINMIATQAEFASVDKILAKLSVPGRLDDYIDEITTNRITVHDHAGLISAKLRQTDRPPASWWLHLMTPLRDDRATGDRLEHVLPIVGISGC